MYSPLPISARKLVRALARRKERQEQRAYLAEGDRLIGELASGSRGGIRFLFGRRERLDWLGELFPDERLYLIDGEGSDLFATENPQGVGAVVAMPEESDLAAIIARRQPTLYLDGISDPGNAGTIIRSAEWFGASGVIFGESSVDPYNPKAVRATMGAIFRVPILTGITIENLVATDLPLYALDANARDHLGESRLPSAAIYAIGNEAHGVSRAVLDAAHPLSIRGSGHGESLNAAIAASVLLYEVSRSREVQEAEIRLP
jgi:TrmH family RNA methyltransferase